MTAQIVLPSRDSSRSGPRLRLLLLSLLLTPLTGLWAQATPEPQFAPENVCSESGEDASVEWLTDDKGQYCVWLVPREQGMVVDEENRTVKFRHTMALQVEGWDEEHFWLKRHRIVAPERTVAEIKEEDRERALASYPGLPEEVDRLEFRPRSEGLPNSGQWRNGFELIDFDGDGRLDVVHGPPRKGNTSRPVVILSTEDGSWTPQERMVLPEGLQLDYGDVAVADFNGDGRQDLALAVHLRGFEVLVAEGEGRFSEWDEGLPSASLKNRRNRTFTSRAIEAVDWNQDGHMDLAAVSEGATGPNQLAEGVHALLGVRVYLNQGDGTWKELAERESDAEDGGVFGDHLVVADLDSDGTPDLVTDARIQGFSRLVRLGRGDGGWDTVAIDDLRPRSIIWSVAVDDLDGDGHQDLAVGYTSAEADMRFRGVDLYFGDGSGQRFVRQGLWSANDVETTAMRTLDTGDFDGDGRRDIVGVTSSGETWVFLGEGERRWLRETSPELDPGDRLRYCVGYRIETADLDGDGRDEVVIGFAGEPGSETLFGSAPICTGRGALVAWSPRPSEETSSPGDSAAGDRP